MAVNPTINSRAIKEHDRAGAVTIGFHIGAAVPTRTKIDDDRHYDQEPGGNAQQELPHGFLAPQTVLFPVDDELVFFL